MTTFILFPGRHEMPAEAGTNAVFDGPVNPIDFGAMEAIAAEKLSGADQEVTLYVTGLTAATIAVCKAALNGGKHLTLMHFDRDSGTYVPQIFC